MNIVIVTQYFWPENFRINDVAALLQRKGHKVTVLTGIPNYPDGKFFRGYGIRMNRRQCHDGVEVIRIPLIPRGNASGIRLAINYLSFAIAATVMAPIRCRDRVDVILVYEPSPVTVGFPALALKKSKDAPVLFWVQDIWPESLSAVGAVRSRAVLAIVKKLVRLIYKRCDLILVQSRAFFTPTEQLGVNTARIRYLPNSAEALYGPVQLPPDACERTELPAGFRVMFAGNIGAAQDFMTILAAAERLKNQADIHWVVLGDGRMRSCVEEQVRERGLSATVHLLGRRPPETMPRYFSLADALLVTLRREPVFALTIPSKVQSYLACARPIIAALDGEGARVIEEAGAGYVLPPESPEELANAVLRMYRTPPSERHEMGLRGWRYFEQHFEPNMLLKRLETWMEEVTGAGKPCVS